VSPTPDIPYCTLSDCPILFAFLGIKLVNQHYTNGRPDIDSLIHYTPIVIPNVSFCILVYNCFGICIFHFIWCVPLQHHYSINYMSVLLPALLGHLSGSVYMVSPCLCGVSTCQCMHLLVHVVHLSGIKWYTCHTS